MFGALPNGLRLWTSGVAASTRTSAVGATEGRSGKLEFEQLEKSQAEWQELLAPRAYEILRKEGTERAYMMPERNSIAEPGGPAFGSPSRAD